MSNEYFEYANRQSFAEYLSKPQGRSMTHPHRAFSRWVLTTHNRRFSNQTPAYFREFMLGTVAAILISDNKPIDRRTLAAQLLGLPYVEPRTADLASDYRIPDSSLDIYPPHIQRCQEFADWLLCARDEYGKPNLLFQKWINSSPHPRPAHERWHKTMTRTLGSGAAKILKTSPRTTREDLAITMRAIR